ncbi:MAG: glycosyltransferase family 39 protein [Lachnospiraceae bacterium]|nr:glycosyltransferase family 39 protein [Lachnospiraceae bacterium]
MVEARDSQKKNITAEKVCFFFPFLIFGISLLTIFFVPLGNGDEIWNYNFAANILKGRLPYRDFNMLQTPLSAYIAAAFLKVAGDGMLNFRILGFLLGMAVSGLLYELCCRISGSWTAAFVVVGLVLGYYSMVWIYDYNQLNLFIILVLMRLEYAQEKETSASFPVFTGVLYGLIPLIKQSTGMIFLLINGALVLRQMFKRKGRREALIQLICSLLPGSIFCIWLLASGIWTDFTDYAVLGISSFSNRFRWTEYISTSFINLLIGLFPVMTIFFSVRAIIGNKTRVGRRLHIRLLILSIGGLTVAYPLCDASHMYPAMVPFIICFFCCFEIKIQRFWQRIVCILTISGMSILSLLAAWLNVADDKLCSLAHFEKIPVQESREEMILEVERYILEQEKQGKSVLIADASAALYMIPIDHYHKDFDMLLVGNVGTKSVDELLADRQDTLYLVAEDETSALSQEHLELIHYIKNYYIKTDKVENFAVYSKNEK